MDAVQPGDQRRDEVSQADVQAARSGIRQLSRIRTAGGSNLSAVASAKVEDPPLRHRALDAAFAAAWLLLQRQLLYAPVGDFADVELCLAPAIHLVDRSKLLDQFARRPEFTEDFAVERQLVDLAVVHRRGWIRLGGAQVLRWARRDAGRRRRTDGDELRLERALGVEHLDAIVATVADVDEPLRVDRHRVRDIELSRCSAARTPRLEILAALVELGDARVAIAVGAD